MSVTTEVHTGAPAISLCPLCRGAGALSFSKHAYEYHRCGCGFVFVWPRPSEKELRDLYRVHGDAYWTTDKMLKYVFSATKASREIAFMRRFVSTGSLLDVGCSTGGFVKAALEAGYDAEGIDISAPAVAFGSRIGLPLRVADLLETVFDRAFDIVTMWATLEHLTEPVAHLAAARSHLQPGGVLFVTVPNYSSLSQRLLGTSYRYVVSEHVNYFTPDVLTRTIAGSGFEVLGKMTYGFNPLRIVKDMMHGESHVVGCEEAANDATQTLSIKGNTVLQRLQGFSERLLDRFELADVVAIAARKC